MFLVLPTHLEYMASTPVRIALLDLWYLGRLEWLFLSDAEQGRESARGVKGQTFGLAF